MIKRTLLTLLTFVCVTSLFAQDGHRILVGGSGTKSIAIIAKDGTIEWEHPITNEANDIAMLKDGSILYAHVKSAVIVDREHNVIWEHKGDPKGEIQSASVLKNGNILIMQNGTPARLMEITRKGKVKVSIEIPTPAKSPHGQFRNIRKTIDGTYLIPYISGNKVCEYSKRGELLRTIEVKGPNFLAVRLKNGNTMVACGDAHRLVEFDKDDNVVWEISGDEIPGNSMFFVAGFQVLPNGNVVLANWGGHGHNKEQAQIIEITREKKVIWSYENWTDFNAFSTVQVLDEDINRGKLYR